MFVGKQSLPMTFAFFFAESLEEDRECDAHTCHISEERGQIFNWIGCDECEKWFHLYCVNLVEPENFICAFYKN